MVGSLDLTQCLKQEKDSLRAETSNPLGWIATAIVKFSGRGLRRLPPIQIRENPRPQKSSSTQPGLPKSNHEDLQDLEEFKR